MMLWRISLLMSCLVWCVQGKSAKKGLCIPPGKNFHCGDLAAFSNVRLVLGWISVWSLFLFALPPSWWYNWRVTPNQEKTPPEDFCTCSSGSCGPPPPGKQFIPMITGYLEEDKPWMDDINDPVDDQYDIILGFNEPNRPDHSDIPPEVAASAWIELQNLYPTKVGQASPTNHQLSSLISDL